MGTIDQERRPTRRDCIREQPNKNNNVQTLGQLAWDGTALDIRLNEKGMETPGAGRVQKDANVTPLLCRSNGDLRIAVRGTAILLF